MKLQYHTSHILIDNVRTFVFKPVEPVSWQAGQYIHYTLPHDNADDRGTERWFTISSAPDEKDIWITTRWFDGKGSSFKKALNGLKPGDEIDVDEPEGDFIDTDTSRNYIFVAGGIGITPFRSILKQLDLQQKPVNVELLYANRDAETIPFKEELEALGRKHDNFHITYFIGDDRIDESTLSEFGEKFDNPMYYVSGPEPMTEGFEKTLKEMGVEDANVKLDFFPGYEKY